METFNRIRNLPEDERKPFSEYLAGQTRPWIEELPEDEQDFFYPSDYQRWKDGLPVRD